MVRSPSTSSLRFEGVCLCVCAGVVVWVSGGCVCVLLMHVSVSISAEFCSREQCPCWTVVQWKYFNLFHCSTTKLVIIVAYFMPGEIVQLCRYENVEFPASPQALLFTLSLSLSLGREWT